jgi:hypothetical protein
MERMEGMSGCDFGSSSAFILSICGWIAFHENRRRNTDARAVPGWSSQPQMNGMDADGRGSWRQWIEDRDGEDGGDECNGLDVVFLVAPGISHPIHPIHPGPFFFAAASASTSASDSPVWRARMAMAPRYAAAFSGAVAEKNRACRAHCFNAHGASPNNRTIRTACHQPRAPSAVTAARAIRSISARAWSRAAEAVTVTAVTATAVTLAAVKVAAAAVNDGVDFMVVGGRRVVSGGGFRQGPFSERSGWGRRVLLDGSAEVRRSARSRTARRAIPAGWSLPAGSVRFRRIRALAFETLPYSASRPFGAMGEIDWGLRIADWFVAAGTVVMVR